MHGHGGIVPSRAPSAAAALLVLAACSPGGAQRSGAPAVPERAPPADATPWETIDIDVTGDDYRWHVTYPGADRVLGTADDVAGERDVHVPEGTPTVLHLHSRDYVYKLRLPHVGKAEIAVPRQDFELRFESGAPGEHELRGDQFCGFSHPLLIGTLRVLPVDAFNQWMAGLPPAPDDEEGRNQQ